MKHHGLTLIELIVVITIMIIISGVSLASYFQFSQRQSALNDARNFVTMLRRVQAMAKNLVYPSGCSSLTGYRVFTNCATYGESCQSVSASAVAVCGVGGEKVITDEKVFTDAYFSAGINVTFIAGSGSLASPVTFPLLNINNVAVSADANGNLIIR